jgi:hypothetical protein
MRVLEPELLDVLPATDERAQQSRRDLRKLNWLMGHERLMAAMLGRTSFDTLIDLGTGDGQFAHNVASRLRRSCRLVLVDQQRVPSAPADLVVSDVMTFLRSLEWQPRTAIMANLFLHHFSDDALRELFLEASGKVECFCACEPRRSRLSLAAIRLLPLIGCNAVTGHDAAASIRAGFLGKELTALWSTHGSADATWEICECECGFGSHCFFAARE